MANKCNDNMLFQDWPQGPSTPRKVISNKAT